MHLFIHVYVHPSISYIILPHMPMSIRSIIHPKTHQSHMSLFLDPLKHAYMNGTKRNVIIGLVHANMHMYLSFHPSHTYMFMYIDSSIHMYVHPFHICIHPFQIPIHSSIHPIHQSAKNIIYIHTHKHTHTLCIWIFRTRTVPSGTFQNLQFKNSLWKQGITWSCHFLESCQEQVVSLLPEFSHLPQHSKISNLQIEPPEKMQNIRPNKHTYTA